jgi:protein-tyrosine-phosphatase
MVPFSSFSVVYVPIRGLLPKNALVARDPVREAEEKLTPCNLSFNSGCDPVLVPAPTTIHFVCTGNIYRSRLAEAYCVSRGVRGLRAFSSGIGAGRDSDAPISPYAADVLAKYNLELYAATRWQRTTAALVQLSDVLVFMEPEHHRFCEDWIVPARQRVEIWGIEDIGPLKAEKIASEVERTFQIIRQRTDALLTRLAR